MQEILHYAGLYHAFTKGDNRYSQEVNNYLSGLYKLNQTTVYLFLYKVFDDFHNQVIDQNMLEKVLRFLLNYSIRRIVCVIPSNSLRGLYKTLYNRVFIRSENKMNYYDAVVSFFQQLTSKDALVTEEVFANDLKFNNLYRKNALCKLLLTSIENQGKEHLYTGNLTIEHIMPQNQNMSTVWQRMLGEDWQMVKDKYLHTIGNLTLTGYNSELGDKPFAEKKEKLAEVHTKIVNLYEDVKNCEVWNSETIERRADRLIAEIQKLFSIEQPATKIVFMDPRYIEYTCEDPENATYKTPNYFVLQGERVNVTNFAEMLRALIERLYSINSTLIELMAKNDERIVSWSQSIMFSYDKNKVNGDLKIKNTDIYENTGYSASHIMHIIKALLEKYDIDITEFVYSARLNKKD